VDLTHLLHDAVSRNCFANLRPEMAKIALNEVVGHAEVDHSRSNGVAELM
jgi:hypothetical protein